MARSVGPVGIEEEGGGVEQAPDADESEVSASPAEVTVCASDEAGRPVDGVATGYRRLCRGDGDAGVRGLEPPTGAGLRPLPLPLCAPLPDVRRRRAPIHVRFGEIDQRPCDIERLCVDDADDVEDAVGEPSPLPGVRKSGDLPRLPSSDRPPACGDANGVVETTEDCDQFSS